MKQDCRLAGYGSMVLESVVGIMAMIAATLLDPGVYFAINTGTGIVGATAAVDAVQTISSWGFPVTVDQMQDLAKEMGESTPLRPHRRRAVARGRHGQHLRPRASAASLMSVWYHFAIMFEAVFILTTVDAGTRVGRFMVQDLHRPAVEAARADVLGIRRSSSRARSSSPAGVTSSYIGVIDPNGGINILWPLFGISNQMLASIALSVATGIIIKKGKIRYALVTAWPLAFLAIGDDGCGVPEDLQRRSEARVLRGGRRSGGEARFGRPAGGSHRQRALTLIFNQNLDGWLTVFFTLVLWFVIGDMLRVAYCRLDGPRGAGQLRSACISRSRSCNGATGAASHA